MNVPISPSKPTSPYPKEHQRIGGVRRQPAVRFAICEMKPTTENADQYPLLDCLIVGGGPAGLVAATYLARFRRRIAVADAGDSRAHQIPMSYNCPGFPDGIAGPDLLERLSDQVTRYNVPIIRKPVDALTRVNNGTFSARIGDDTVYARHVILAIGVVDIAPQLPEIGEAIARGSLRLCPVCDGYEVSNRKVAVIGASRHAIEEASFLKTFTKDVTLLVNDRDDLEPGVFEFASERDIAVVCDVEDMLATREGYEVVRATQERTLFDVVYPALACSIRSELAESLLIELDDMGHIVVDSHQETSMSGVFAAGDVVHSLNQIAVAYGQAATAATAVHNRIRG